MTYISKTVNLTPEQVEEIAKTRISYSVFIRDLLDEKSVRDKIEQEVSQMHSDGKMKAYDRMPNEKSRGDQT